MDVEKTIPNSTDDYSTKHATQDRHDQDISSNLHKKKIVNLSMILTPMKTMMMIIKSIKRKCESLQTKQRSILLPQFFQSVLNLNFVCLFLYVIWFLCLLCDML